MIATHTQQNSYLIDSQAVINNISSIRDHLPARTRLMAVVKAGGYGTDMAKMARLCHSCGIDAFGVARAFEGAALRQAGITGDVFVFYPTLDDAETIVENSLTACVSDLDLVNALARKAKSPVPIHLHIDTGMKRLGCPIGDALFVAKAIANNPKIVLDGCLTHFAAAEDPLEDIFSFEQTRLFDRLLQDLKKEGISPKWRHAANSAAVARFSLPQYNMARVGLALYGAAASQEAACSLKLKLALSLSSRVIGIHHCEKGETVGYGRTFVATKPTKIATVPLGYYDGIHRLYSNRGHVLIKEQIAPIVGKISMDAMTIDVSNIDQVAIGDPVTLFDDAFRPEVFAHRGGTIMHELMSCLGPRVPRIFSFCCD